MKTLQEVLQILNTYAQSDISGFYDDESIVAAILLAHEIRRARNRSKPYESFDHFIITNKHQYQEFLDYFQSQLSMVYYRCHIYFRDEHDKHWYLIELIKTGSKILIGQFDSNCQKEPVSFVRELLQLKLPRITFAAGNFGTYHKTGSGCSIFVLDMSFRVEYLPKGLFYKPQCCVKARALRNTQEPINERDEILNVTIDSRNQRTLGAYLRKHSLFKLDRFINCSYEYKIIEWAQKAVTELSGMDEADWEEYFTQKTHSPSLTKKTQDKVTFDFYVPRSIQQSARYSSMVCTLL